MSDHLIHRRQAIKILSGFAAGGLCLGLGQANVNAAVNEASRKALQYQPTPKGGKQCSGCIHFVPGKTPADKGGCKVIPGDTEISPAAWCSAYVDSPAKK